MSPRLHTLLLFVAAAMLVALTGGPAIAATATVHDQRGDAAAGADIVSATYVNADRFVRFSVKVRNLGTRGNFHFIVGQPRSDEAMVARVTRGRLRWGVQSVTSTTWIRCSGSSHLWMEARDIVQVYVPRACVNRRGYQGALYMLAMSNDGYGDYAAGRVVQRG